MRRAALITCVVLGGLGGLAGCGTDDPGGSIITPGVTRDMGGGGGDMGGADMAPTDMGPTDMGGGQDMGGVDMTTSPTTCESARDCTAPQICLINPSTGAKTCGAPVGGGETGATCSDGSQCASGVCFNGECAGPCDNAQDCPNGWACEETQVPLDGGQTAALKVCVEQASPCLSNSACSSPQICVVDRSSAPPSLTCQDPVPGAGGLGAVCNADSECASGLCLDGACTLPCERPNDCSTDGSYVCQPAQVQAGGQTTTINVCAPKPADQCLSDGQCAAPKRCVATRGATDVAFTCQDPAGAGEVGALCSDDSACAQGFCLNGACAPPCQSNGDCAAAPGHTCELREVQLTGSNKDTVQVCVPPVACQDASACRITEACFVQRGPSNIETFCRAPNPAGGQLGQVCNSDTECAAGLCLNGRFGKVCSTPCDDASDCNVTGYTCRTSPVATTGGGTVDRQVCAPADPPACTSNDGCQTGLVCAVVPNTAGTALEAACIPGAGRVSTGVPCSSDDQCASRVCINNTCAAPCTTGNQCAASQTCVSSTVSRGGLSGTFDLCETPPEQQCTSSGSCADGVRVCGDLRNNNGQIEAFCRFPSTDPAAKQLGDACTTNSECREGVCLATSGECSVACAQDADCSAAAGQICADLVGSSTFGLCTTGCTDDASCGAGRVCTIRSDSRQNQLDQICLTADTSKAALGAACSSANDCISGVCLSTLLYDGSTSCTSDAQCTGGRVCRCPVDNPGCTTGKQCAEVTDRCTRICDDSADCSGGAAGNQLTTCSPDIYVTLPNGTSTQQVSACSQPPS